jgi:GxxExxY protein
MTEVLHPELSFSTVGAALEVHRQLGPGFLEVVYERALEHELTLRQIPFSRQVTFQVRHKGIAVGKYRADLIVDDKLIVEIKASSNLIPVHQAQALNYLKATGLRLAILFNFGRGSMEVKRLVL